MKLSLFLMNAAVALALTIFDYYTFHDVFNTVNIIDKLSLLLDQRGRDRYKVQKHYTDWLDADTPQEQLVAAFKKSDLFEREPADLPSASSLDNWSKIHFRNNRRDALDQLKLHYLKLVSIDKSNAVKPSDIQKWSVAMVDLLDEIQRLDVQLSNRLSNDINQTLKSTVFVNATALICLFLITVIILHHNQQGHLRRVRLINDQLVKRQNELWKSKKTLLSVMEDLSQEKNAATTLSDQLQYANEGMQRKNEEMEQFVYTVSHDLKSPLVTIGGFAKKLDDELHPKLTEKQQHRLQRIQDNVSHMQSLLMDLLQLSRVIRQELEKSFMDVETVITQQCRILENDINETRTRITVHSPLHTIVANERLLSQCILNLFTNAIKYRDITRPLIINVSTEQNDQYTSLMIKDNGIGIEEKYHQQIFRIFERLGHDEGMGVGLTIVKTIMEKHAGKVQLTSEFGTGSQFTLVFPTPSTAEIAA